ncbi:MAG: hypothetical protein AAF252_12070 [Pseudomonadota bacterium]
MKRVLVLDVCAVFDNQIAKHKGGKDVADGVGTLIAMTRALMRRQGLCWGHLAADI